ncbi:hypothetical protein [Sporomusa acidovorans]|uniref:Uncharacterized protein n=1 Tax=Sporomusa acidovorans (strain ATCC 49682 / DSM 3132 / Mol) TaxID=1123286 RepID=A0ABZ3J9C4_SPOA4|nr:hypothetical protein [Sporomusa acidovorans]OZC16135.1 hypothetical protein SPACI_45020 [Sporomusa acidovorans DSM 3132]SDF83088.1 hypothetical protein SAMN04488499_10936 [Sporomusa acidovorans]
MITKADIVTFIHFIDFYWNGLNGAGTFTLEELVEWVKQNEDSKYLERLLKESLLLKEVFTKEDWEIDSSILDFIIKNRGKNKIKRIVDCLLKISDNT